MTAPTSRRAAIYTRVSTDEQDAALQERALKDYARQNGYSIVRTFTDPETDHEASPMDRAGFKAMTAAAKGRWFEYLLVTSLDRLSRGGVRKMLDVVESFEYWGVAVVSLREKWLPTEPAQRAMLLASMGYAAEIERAAIKSRMKVWYEGWKKELEEQGKSVPLRGKDKKPRTRRWYKKPLGYREVPALVHAVEEAERPSIGGTPPRRHNPPVATIGEPL